MNEMTEKEVRKTKTLIVLTPIIMLVFALIYLIGVLVYAMKSFTP